MGNIVPPADPVEVEGDIEYEVDQILSHRHVGRRRRLEYLVSFVGYDSSYNEWLPAHNLVHAPEKLKEYKQRTR